jgi:hypothetical protein
MSISPLFLGLVTVTRLAFSFKKIQSPALPSRFTLADTTACYNMPKELLFALLHLSPCTAAATGRHAVAAGYVVNQ